jgi:ATP-dependent exoDNAse (exonuclease V) alpha subunit
VVIDGHAGTGKSTTLTGIARAHQATGRHILVVSTAAVAAERLARELTAARVDASAHSTVALHNAITSGRIELGAGTTIIHDEAALASTREQERLLAAVEESGARLIEIGDPRQSHPVGAGGLWPRLEHAARHAGGHVELTRNQRARDPADRRDQALFRDGQHEHAIRGYAARDRLHIASEQPDAENRALDAAHAERSAGKTTIVIAQTSNDHLDELNARAQAIRRQHGELGPETPPVPGRPYALHAGDEIQIRRTIPHPDHGQLRNGTAAHIADIDPAARTVTLQLADERKVTLDAAQVARADVRLTYVQHPFPAQGQTNDTAHLIIAEHATREGSYVALTRAREQTHIHTASPEDEPIDGDRLQALSERMSRQRARPPIYPHPARPRVRRRADGREDKHRCWMARRRRGPSSYGTRPGDTIATDRAGDSRRCRPRSARTAIGRRRPPRSRSARPAARELARAGAGRRRGRRRDRRWARRPGVA